VVQVVGEDVCSASNALRWFGQSQGGTMVILIVSVANAMQVAE